MSDTPVNQITPASNAVSETYNLAIAAFSEWRKSFETHKEEEGRFAEAFARHEQDPEITMPVEYEGIETAKDLAYMNANKRGYLEGRFEGICQVLSTIAGGDPMDWNVRIQNETTGK